jgi:hypothetical protein
VEWFLNRPDKVDAKATLAEILKVKTAVNQAGGEITGTALKALFSHKSPDQRAEIATRAGLKVRKTPSGKGGPALVFWSW